jgi:CheY-like chemotaxis protein
MSGYGMEADISRTRAAGFHDHLIKPVRIERLEGAIRSAMEHRFAKIKP